MRLSLRLTLVFSFFGLAIAGGFQYFHVRELRRESYARALNMAEVTSTAIRSMVENRAAQPNFGGLGKSLQEMVRQSGIAYIVVRDAKGRRLVGRSDAEASRSHEPRLGTPIDEVRDGIYDVERPVDLGPRGKGTVLLGFHTAALEARLREVGAKSVRLGVMAFLAIAIFAWLLGAWLGLRLERLLPRIEALPRDPEGFRPIKGGVGPDELSRLVEAFNRLGASLKSETLRRRDLEVEKAELSAMLVHDLKTPLTVIRSGIALLQEQVGEAKAATMEVERVRPGRAAGTYRRTFELLELSAKRLQRMIEDVLQLARLEEVRGLREREPVDLAALARACAKDFELIAGERGQKLQIKLPKGSVPPVLGDAALLRRVLDNLVYNAVEHTPADGAITISAEARGAEVRVSVSDSGPGIPVDARTGLFTKFFQRDVKRHVGNVGLGLALCQKVVSRHDGSIGVEDAEPHGARFYFSLPSAEPALPL